MRQIGIVLVNYHDYATRFLADCAASLRRQTFPASDFICYVVDNDSSLESRETIKQIFPEAVIIPRPDGNYCAANNVGLKQAFADGCVAAAIVNMDTIFDGNWLAELVRAAGRHPQAGILQSLILLYPKVPALINSSGNRYHFLGYGFTNDYRQSFVENSWREDRSIDGYASGCSLFITRACYEKIGGYNEEYYMYHDDLELCARAHLAGFEIWLAPRSRLWHKYEFSRSQKMIYYQERNRWLFILQYYSWLAIFLLAPMLFLLECGLLLYALKNHWFYEKIKAYFYFLKPANWIKIAKFRFKIKQMAVLKQSRFFANFQGKLNFLEIDNPVLKYIGNPIMSAYWRVARIVIAR